MTTEYGIFNDEGLVEGDFEDRVIAEYFLSEYFLNEEASDEDVFVAVVLLCERCDDAYPEGGECCDDAEEAPREMTQDDYEQQVHDLRQGR